jgi:DNA gyrase/topoisomerase IV subunit A
LLCCVKNNKGLSANQSEAVLGLQLGRLTSLDEANLASERVGLERDMASLGQLLESAPATWSVIKEELALLKKKHAVSGAQAESKTTKDSASQSLLLSPSSIHHCFLEHKIKFVARSYINMFVLSFDAYFFFCLSSSFAGASPQHDRTHFWVWYP